MTGDPLDLALRRSLSFAVSCGKLAPEALEFDRLVADTRRDVEAALEQTPAPRFDVYAHDGATKWVMIASNLHARDARPVAAALKDTGHIARTVEHLLDPAVAENGVLL